MPPPAASVPSSPTQLVRSSLSCASIHIRSLRRCLVQNIKLFVTWRVPNSMACLYSAALLPMSTTAAAVSCIAAQQYHGLFACSCRPALEQRRGHPRRTQRAAIQRQRRLRPLPDVQCAPLPLSASRCRTYFSQHRAHIIKRQYISSVGCGLCLTFRACCLTTASLMIFPAYQP